MKRTLPHTNEKSPPLVRGPDLYKFSKPLFASRQPFSAEPLRMSRTCIKQSDLAHIVIERLSTKQQHHSNKRMAGPKDPAPSTSFWPKSPGSHRAKKKHTKQLGCITKTAPRVFPMPPPKNNIAARPPGDVPAVFCQNRMGTVSLQREGCLGRGDGHRDRHSAAFRSSEARCGSSGVRYNSGSSVWLKKRSSGWTLDEAGLGPPPSIPSFSPLDAWMDG